MDSLNDEMFAAMIRVQMAEADAIRRANARR
jgi:hypothetical protein